PGGWLAVWVLVPTKATSPGAPDRPRRATPLAAAFAPHLASSLSPVGSFTTPGRQVLPRRPVLPSLPARQARCLVRPSWLSSAALPWPGTVPCGTPPRKPLGRGTRVDRATTSG